MRANIVFKTAAVLSLMAGIVASPLVALADEGWSANTGSAASGNYDHSKMGQDDGSDGHGLVTHTPSVFDSYIPGQISNSSTKPPLAFRGGLTGTDAAKNTAYAGISSNPKVYLIFWGSQWGTTGTTTDAAGASRLTFSNDPAGMAPYVQSLLAGLGTNSESWSTVLAQYCDGIAVGATTCAGNAAARFVGYPTGGALAGVWYDNAAVAPTTASQAQLAAEAKAGAVHFGNTTQPSNASTQYVVVSATGMHPNGFNTSTANWCAWHDYAADATIGNFAYTNLPYIPDMKASCGQGYVNGTDGVLDGVGIVEGHEYAETVTDQWPASGWTDQIGYENGDDCSWTGPTGGQGGNLVLSTGTFAMQGTWSNADNNCSMGALNVISAGLPTVKTGAAYTTTAISGGFTNYTYSLTSGALPTGLSLSATGVITGTATVAGNYSYTLTVTDAKGSTATGTINLTVASSIPTSITASASATAVTTSTPVTLTATLLAPTGDASGKTVTFKDGTTVLGTAVTDVTGVATLPARTFTGGNHSITAVFTATGLYLGSTSPAVVVSSAAAVTSLALATSPSAGISPTTSVIMTATISPIISGATITFYDGTTSLGTAKTSTAGVATLAKTFAGSVAGTTHTLSAKVTATTSYTASTSNSVVLVSTIVAPGAPTNPTLTASTAAGAATAKWTAPTSNGGSTITGYVVTVYDSTGTVFKTVTTTTTSTSLSVTGLTSKAVFTFKVAAKNVAGTGVQSVSSTAATIK